MVCQFVMELFSCYVTVMSPVQEGLRLLFFSVRIRCSAKASELMLRSFVGSKMHSFGLLRLTKPLTGRSSDVTCSETQIDLSLSSPQFLPLFAPSSTLHYIDKLGLSKRK